MRSLFSAFAFAIMFAPGAMAAPFDGAYGGTIACEAIGSSAGFAQKVAFIVRNGRFAVEKGTPGTANWERMSGTVTADGALAVEGAYFADHEKPIAFAGRIDGTRMRASGPRGPRTCVLEAAAQPPSGVRPPFKGVPDSAIRDRIGKPGAAFTCPAPPAPVRDVMMEPFYQKGDLTHSIVDHAAYEALQKATRPLHEMSSGVARLGDRYLQTAPRSPEIAACLAVWLDSWATAGAMLGRATMQGAFERKWTLTTLSLNYVLLRDAPEVGAERAARIEAWLADLAWATVPNYAAKPFAEQNNHLNWAALAALATAVAVQDQGLFDWSIAAARGCLGNVDADGSLPHELKRAAKAMHYHRFALEPLILAAEIAAANRIDLYAENERALPRLVAYTRAVMLDPDIMAKRVGVTQSVVGADGIRPSMWAWAEPYIARFDDKDLAGTVAPLRGKGLSTTWLGGDLTLRFAVRSP